MLSDIKKLINLSVLSRSYILIIFLYVVSSCLDIIGLSLVGGYISFFLDQKNNSQFFFIFEITKAIDFIEPILSVGILILIIFIFKFFFFLMVNFLIINFSNKQLINMRNLLISKYQNLNYLDFIKKNKSEYIYNAKDLSRAFSQLIISILKISGEIIITTFIIIFLFFQNAVVTSTAMIVIFFLYFVYDKIFKNKLNKYGKSLNESSHNMYKYISEAMVGLKEIRILGKETYFYNQIKESTLIWTNAFKNISLISLMTKYLFEYFFIFLIVLFTLIIFFTGKNLQEYLPLVAIFVIAGIRLFPITNSILNSIIVIRTGRNSIERIYDVITTIPSSDRYKKNLNNEKNIFLEKFEKLELANISFGYSEQSELVFNEASLVVKSESTIGLTGKSGSGKSTLIDIIVGILEPNKGQIKINNKKINSNLSFIHNSFSYIPQQLFLVDGTVYENVALGIEKNKIDFNKVNQSIKKASLSDFIEDLPEGLNTKIGDNGIKISGGQRQRIGIARSFYFEKPVIIFDEVTNALDEKTEKEIMQNIEELKGKRTIFIVTHKEKLLNFCDEIYEIKNQRILKKN